MSNEFKSISMRLTNLNSLASRRCEVHGWKWHGCLDCELGDSPTVIPFPHILLQEHWEWFKSALPMEIRRIPVAAEASRKVQTQSEPADPVLSPPGSTVPSCHLAEVQGGDQLHLYASGSLEALDRQWGLQAAGQITTVRFSFVDFDEIAVQLHKLRARFPAVQNLIFQSTNLHSLAQMCALANLRRLEAITIEAEGNPLTQFTLWRPFLLYRLSHLGLKRVNGEEVRPGEILSAERLFSPLSHMTTSQLTQAHLLTLLTEAKRKQQQQQQAMGGLVPTSPELAVGKLGLVYANAECKETRRQAGVAKKAVAVDILTNIVRESVSAEDNRETLAGAWPRLLRTLMSRALQEYVNSAAAPSAASAASSTPAGGGVRREDLTTRRS